MKGQFPVKNLSPVLKFVAKLLHEIHSTTVVAIQRHMEQRAVERKPTSTWTTTVTRLNAEHRFRINQPLISAKQSLPAFPLLPP